MLHVLLLLLPLGRAVSSPVPAKPIAPPRRTHGAWSLSSFRDFVDARLGPPSCPVVWWALEGQLTSPTTGDVIAEVRGLEVVRCVGRGGLGGEKKKKGDGSAVAYAGLSTEGCLSSSPAGREVEAYATAVSRRAFLYLDPVTKQPMTSFRMSRRSKARDVPLPAPLVRVLTFALVVVKRRSSSTSQGEEQGQQQQSQQQDVTSSRVMTLVSERLAGGETVAVGGGTMRRRACCWLAGWLSHGFCVMMGGWCFMDCQVDSEGGPFLPPKRHQRWPVGGGKRLDLSLLTWPGSTRKKRRRHGEDEEEQGGPRAWLRGLVHLGPMRAAPAVREVREEGGPSSSLLVCLGEVLPLLHSKESRWCREGLAGWLAGC